MNSSDSAEELIKIYLDGVGFALRIAGEGSKNLIAILMAMSKDKTQTKGKTRLTNMLKTGKELKIFTIKAEDLKKFSQEAKRYGILYCILADKKNDKIDGMVDIMVRQEDASKVNRIAERFNFIDVATIKNENDKEKQEKLKIEEQKSETEKIVDDLLAEPEEIEKQENDMNSPSNDKSEEKSPSESSLDTKSKLENDELYHNGKKSVKKELHEIQKQVEERDAKAKEQEKGISEIVNTKEKKEDNHLQKENKKNKGKHFKEPKHLDTTRKNKKKKRNKVRERSL